MRETKVHELKTWREYYYAVTSGRKTFEYRKDDRDYQVNDILVLRHWNPDGGYTGEAVTRTITYILRDFEGLAPGWCVMGLR